MIEDIQLHVVQLAPSAEKALYRVFGSPENALFIALVCLILGLSLLVGVYFSKIATKWQLCQGLLTYILVFSFGVGVIWLSDIEYALVVGLIIASAVLVVATLVTLSIINQMMEIPVSE